MKSKQRVFLPALRLFAFLLLLPLLGNAQLSYPSPLKNEIDQIPIDSSARKLVVLIHGWNPDYNIDKYQSTAEWYYLLNVLKLKLSGTGWKLVAYHWEPAAATGPVMEIITDALEYGNASVAAVHAQQEGATLATLLTNQAPDLRHVQFIAHSAGSWAAREAMKLLLERNPYVVTEMTLLDPFIPDASALVGATTGLSTPVMSSTKTLLGNDRIYRLENYFADDVISQGSVFGTISTQEQFAWRDGDTNLQIEWGFAFFPGLFAHYDSHAGPIEFYADSAAGIIPSFRDVTRLIGPPYDASQVGWYRSIYMNESALPSILTHPKAPQPIPQGDNATLQVVASRATSYLWFRNGASTGVTTPSINLMAISANEGDYVVRVKNNAGQVFSEKARFSIATASSRPTISLVSPRTLSGRPLPQTQRVTISGTLFAPSSTLTFYDQINTNSGKVPVYVSSTELKFDIAVGPNAANWTVKVVNGVVASDPFSFSVTSASDTTAPSAPTGLSATRWAGGNQFLLDWTNPSDPSGLAKAWVKLGSVPVSPTDGIAYPLPANKPLQITLPVSSGSQSVHLWLEDGLGNRNQNNRATITIGTDINSPVVRISSPSANPLTTAQSSVVLSGTYGDDLSGVTSVKWQNISASLGEATMTGSALSGSWSTPAITLHPGLNIISVAATDGAGNVGTAAIQVNYVDTSNSGSVTVTLTPQGAIDQGAQWRVNAGTWRNSGYTEQNVPTGPRFVEFMNIPGSYLTPVSFFVNVTAGQNISDSRIYTFVFVPDPPNTPSNPSPAQGAVNVGRAQPRFSWTGDAPGGDLQYAFCIDLNNLANPDPPFYTGWGALTDNSFQFPGNTFTLPVTTTVNWRVKARANGITVDGPVWRFTTEYAVADLAVKNLALDGNVEPGANVTLSATVTNQGNFVAPTGYLFYYLSRIPGGKEIRLNLPVSLIVWPLQPGQSTNITFSAKLDGLPAGQSFIDAWVDTTAYGATGESNFENNLTSIQLNYIDGKNPQVTYAALSTTFVKTGVAKSIVYVATDDVGVKTMDFYYSTDDGVTWVPIQEGYVPTTPPFAGAVFNWTVPADLTVGASLKVRVVARDTSGNSGETNAGPYLIHSGTAPTITVLSPNGGELWNMGSQQQISWNLSAPNGVSQFSVLFYHDNAIDFLPVPFSSTNGPYTWTLPAALSTTTAKIRIRVQDLNGNNSEDFSDGFFSIRDTSSAPPAPWTSPQSVGTGASSSSFTKVVTDQAGNLHLISGTPTGFQYTKKTGGTWSNPASVTAVTGAVDTLNMVVDSQGHPHLVWNNSASAYADQNKQDVFYTFFNGASWSGPQNLSSTVIGNYNVNTLTWSSAPSLPTSEYDTASCVINGKLYVLSGSGPLYEFNPSTGVWSTKANMPGGWSSPRAIGVNGRMYVFFGGSGSVVRIYNPAADSWTTGASMPTARDGVSLASINGMIYAIGGTTSAKNEMYNPASDTWTTLADMPTARNYAAAAAVGNSIYVIGGEKGDGLGLNTIEVYDPASNTWGVPNIPGGANWPRRQGAVAYALNNRIYLCGGRSWDYLNTVDEYDPASNSYQSMTPMQSSRAYASGGVIGNNIYVVGGYDGTNSMSSMEKASISSSPVGAISRAPAIAIDSNDTVHVVWFDGSFLVPDGNSNLGFSGTGTNVLYYVSKANGQGWSGLTQLTSTSGYPPALCVDRSNSLHVSFIGYLSNVATVFYMKNVGGVWSIPNAITTGIDDSLRMSVDSSNHLHLVGRHFNPASGHGEISYIYSDGVSVDPNQVIYSSSYASHPTIGTDSFGRPHATWEDQNYPSLLLYSFKSGNNWSSPVQLNFTSQLVVNNSSDAALSSVSNELHAVWISTVNGTPQVLYNHANVGSTNDIFAPSVSVSTPTSGQNLSIGSSFSIQWNATDNTGVTAVSIHYSTNSGSSWTLIATNQANNGTFVWLVPNLGTNVGQIRVTARDAAGNSGVGYSGTFTTTDLTPPTITIIAPTNGATLIGDATNSVVWTATDNAAVARIDLEYSLNNGASWSDLATNLTNGGSYRWLIPNSATTVLLIRATARDTAGLSASATTQPMTIVRGNTPPLAPNSPFPLDGSTFVLTISPQFSWSSSDLDGDPLTYQIRFGTNATPPIVSSGTAPSFAPGFLRPQKAYYWQVIASDGKATTTGQLWSFTTEAGALPATVLADHKRLINGVFQFRLSGLFGESYSVQASTNLMVWQTLTNIVNTNANTLFLDTAAINFPWRFYRAVSP